MIYMWALMHAQQVSCIGPSFACLFMGYLETKILEMYTGRKPDLFQCYIGDCVGAASCSSDELCDFIDYFANFHPSIKVTFDISASHLPFLDILLSISGDRLATSMYYKPTDVHTFLSSSHM